MLKYNAKAPKSTSFSVGQERQDVTYIETQTVKDGVECDIYEFASDKPQDLAIVRVTKGFKTPLQQVVGGIKTVEAFIEGTRILTVRSNAGKTKKYNFGLNSSNESVEVGVGEVMQWTADKDSDLVFSEICTPPYQDGRVKDLPEQ